MDAIYNHAAVQRVLFRFVLRVDLSAVLDSYHAYGNQNAYICTLFDQEFANLRRC
jgi:hypothetical protein